MIDRYTKAVLTVIAGALVALVGQNAIAPGRAADPDLFPRKVQICDDMRCAGLSPIVLKSDGRYFTVWGLTTAQAPLDK
jgi:hypothetical protein